MSDDTPLPQPPFFLVPNVNNLRDAALFPGSLPTASPPGKVRTGILFRSAEVAKLDTEGWKKVYDIGVGRVFDLRSKPEVDKGWAGIVGNKAGESGGDVRPGWIKGMEEAGVKRDWVPVFEESDYSPERLAERYSKYMGESVEGFVQAYQDILQNAGPSFRTILLYLANLPAPTPTSASTTTFLSNDSAAPTPSTSSSDSPLGALIHCTAGKDRTGIFFGLLFSFLGVNPQIIAEEYNLTEQGLACIREEVVGRLMLSPGFKKYMSAQMAGKTVSTADLAELIRKQREDEASGVTPAKSEETGIPPEVMEKGRQAALRMVGASKESMIQSLKMLDREYGSAEGYMRKVCGLGDVELESLRRNLVVAEA